MPPKSRHQATRSSSSAANSSGRRVSSCGDHLHQNRKQQRSGLQESASSIADDSTSSTPPPNLYRVRSFTTRSGTVVNRGDSFKLRTGRGRPIAATSGELTDANGRRMSCRRSMHGSANGDDDDEGGGPQPGLVVPTWADSVVVVDEPGVGRPRQDRVRAANASVETARSNGARYRADDNRYSGLMPTAAGGGGGFLQANGRNDIDDDDDDGASSSTTVMYNVVVLGGPGVGKTTMTQQLLTSEYLANKEFSVADEPGTGDAHTTVTVQIDDEESTVRFIDNHGSEGKEGSFRGMTAGGDGYLVVYSVTDRSSFRYAQACLQELRPAKRLNAVILVANKYDLVRNRVVSTSEGVRLATKRHCKFLEISALLDHRIDELLVGIVRQIRLRQSDRSRGPPDDVMDDVRPRSTRGRILSSLGDTLRTFLARVHLTSPPWSSGGSRQRQAECNNLFTP